MSSAYAWLTSLIDCKAVAQFFTPTPPINVEDHLRKMNSSLDLLENRKARLVHELHVLQRQREELKRKGQNVAIVEQQLMQHIGTIKEIDARNKQIVAQYNEVARANNRREMLATSVETTKVLTAVSRDIKVQLRSVGGTDKVQEVIDNIGDTMDEADRLSAFTSRAVLPEGMDTFRETGVLPKPLSLDDELSAYLDISPAASSVSEPTAIVSSPYGDAQVAVPSTLIQEPA